MVSQNCREIFEYSSKELIGQKIWKIMPKLYAQHHTEYINNYIETGKLLFLNKTSTVLALNKKGFLFQCHLFVKFSTQLELG